MLENKKDWMHDFGFDGVKELQHPTHTSDRMHDGPSCCVTCVHQIDGCGRQRNQTLYALLMKARVLMQFNTAEF